MDGHLAEYLSAEALWALASVIAIDVALAGDNAIVVGMAAAGLPTPMRRKAIIIGIVAATVMRVVFAIFTVQLLQIIGLLIAGGLLLLWVSWKLWRETRANSARTEDEGVDVLEGDAIAARPTKTYRQAITQIVIADVSMSLDNVLAVAGAARDHTWVLIIGLVVSVALMGLCASYVARLLQRHHWIAYIGLAIIVYVALAMIYEGSLEVMTATEEAGMIDWPWLGRND